MFMQILDRVKKEVHNIVSGESFVDDGTIHARHIIPSRAAILHAWFAAVPNISFFAGPAYDKIQAASSSRSESGSKTSPKHLTIRCKTSPMRIRRETANSSSEDLPVIVIESARE